MSRTGVRDGSRGPLDAQFRSFADHFSGEIIGPDDAKYAAARAVWNGTIDRRPALIVRPTGQAAVLSALRFAREKDLLVAVRSGGHSIPGFGTCDGGVVIDLSAMRGVRVDAGAGRARVNGGTLLAELDYEAQAFGLVCPIGVVANTGVAGLTLGGGMGRLQRKFGLTIDHLLSVDLVTADGRLVRAAPDENPELFWGIRGAGANFGIVTSLEFGLEPFDGAVVHGSLVYPIARVDDVAAAYRDLVERAPTDLTATFGLGRATPHEAYPPEIAGEMIVIVGALHCGSPQQADHDLAALRSLGPVTDSIGPATYLASQHAADEAMTWGRRFYMASGFLASLNDGVLRTAIESLAGAPASGDSSIGLWSWGGAIADVDDEATAFTGRAAAYWMAVESMWEEAAHDAIHRSWCRATRQALAAYMTAGRYVNDVPEAEEGVIRSVYGSGKLGRLVALKRAWDPDNVFRLNQNIDPSRDP